MIKKEVFDEFKNRGLITNVEINHENYTDLADLQNKGYVTVLGTEKLYAELNGDEPTNEDVTEPENTDNTNTGEENGEDIVVDDNNDTPSEE